MRIFRILFTTMFLMISIVVMAIEPSTEIVSLNGKTYYRHKVEVGHTLYALSNAYNVAEQDIIDANNGLTAQSLKAGSYIFIPCEDVGDDSSDEARDKRRYIYHEVKSGETIYAIARRYKISVAILESDNSGVNLENLEQGSVIKVRRSERGYATSDEIEQERIERSKVASLGANEHIVVSGETVYSLSRRFGMSELEFMSLNNLQNFNDLKVGMVVKFSVEESVASESPLQDVDASAGGNEDNIVVDAPIIDQAKAEDSADVALAQWPYDSMWGFDDAFVDSDKRFITLAPHQTLKASLLLPFHRSGRVNANIVDFYRGVLLAMEDLKHEGFDIDLSVFDTYGSSDRVAEIVEQEQDFQESHLIIGPVYESVMDSVVRFAEQRGVPVVSPLAEISSLQSPVLFQMHAATSHKYDDLERYFDGSREAIVIYAQGIDAEFESVMSRYASMTTRQNLNYAYNRESLFYHRNANGSNGASVDITALMRTATSKVFIIVASSEVDIDRILTTLSSTRASIAGRGGLYGDYVVMGNRKWKQISNIDKQTFFNNNTLFVVPYHANRGNAQIRYFDGRYAQMYNTLPSMYSYRGYDAAMIFCRKMFSGLDSSIEGEQFMPLATPYSFVLENGIYVNSAWTLEHYMSNFTIETE